MERMIAETPRVARRQQEELRVRATARDRRLDASVAQDKRYGNDSKSTLRRRPLRKERREGRLLFLVLVIAIAVVVIWLMRHLHFLSIKMAKTSDLDVAYISRLARLNLTDAGARPIQ